MVVHSVSVRHTLSCMVFGHTVTASNILVIYSYLHVFFSHGHSILHRFSCSITAAPPEVEVTATLTRVVVGNSTTLTCTVTRSNPMGSYTYRWMHNNSITLPGETSSMLTVSILSESNLGVYLCEVINSANLTGSNTTTIELGGEYWQ